VELKVIELPTKRYRDPFYYLGQIASDFARLSLANGLDGGQLAALLFGDIFRTFPTQPKAILRHFQKEMSWAYAAATFEDGPLHAKSAGRVAHYRREACRQMGFDIPYPDYFDQGDENFDGRFSTKVVDQQFMFIVIPIKKDACKPPSS
jgi:hypothetical protein